MIDEVINGCMDPYLRENKVVVEDTSLASTLMNKGNFGSPQSGGGSHLSLVEAAYLVERARISVKRSRKGRTASLAEIIARGLDLDPSFLKNLMVFRDLRNRGLVVTGEDTGDWTVYPRGKRPSNGRADTWVNVYREHDPVSLLDIWRDSRSKENMRMGLVASIVDSDWDVTHYRIRCSLEENTERSDLPGVKGKTARTPIEDGGAMISGKGVDDTVVKSCIGTALEGALLLSSEEDRMLFDGDADELKFRTYTDLRSRGYLPRTGFKYGAHFRVYTKISLEDHSKFLVHCVDRDRTFTWEELSRTMRLSHSVRKRFLFSIPSEGIGEPHHHGNGPLYLEIAWTRL
ncbi:MAG: tRNA-intron lyase [Candidatus Thermoplasmatota archaeon]|nr:tRNA-intron lyase [Candidatus Thermoplasmatota archaeon]